MHTTMSIYVPNYLPLHIGLYGFHEKLLCQKWDVNEVMNSLIGHYTLCNNNGGGLVHIGCFMFRYLLYNLCYFNAF